MREKYIPAYEEKNLKVNRRKVITPVILIVLLLCVLAGGTLVAKYINERSSGGWVRAQWFYFTSDLLDEQETTHTLAPGSTSISFTLGNHEDDLRYSEMDIEYTVTVTPQDSGTSAATVGITDSNGNAVTGNAGTLKAGEVTDATVTISGLAPGTYTVTAVGKGGYEKTLKAKIVVPEDAAKLYYHMDDSAGEYTLLTVWNEGDKAGNVTITYTGIPDNTNPNMTDWKTSDGTSGKEVTISPYESKVFRFFNETVNGIAVTGKDSTEVTSKPLN